jgi:multidrug transporter EmrE-like cation transporter
MINLSPSLLVVLGMVSTTLAQVLLKRAAFFEIKTSPWLMYMAIAAAAYVLSFALYSQILKHFELNKIYPAMTVGQIMLVTLYGLVAGEMVSGRHAMGLLLGGVAIYLILT